MPITVAQVIAQVRTRTDQDGFNQIEDTDHLVPWISKSYARLWTLALSTNPDAFLSTATFTLAAGVDQQDLIGAPVSLTDFWKLVSVEQTSSSPPRELGRFMWSERNRTVDLSTCLIGTVLHIRPTALAPGPYRIYYLPTAPALTAVSSLDDRVTQNQWDEWLINDVCVMVQNRLRKPAAPFEAARDKIEAEIKALANDRDASHPRTVENVYGDWDLVERWGMY